MNDNVTTWNLTIPAKNDRIDPSTSPVGVVGVYPQGQDQSGPLAEVAIFRGDDGALVVSIDAFADEPRVRVNLNDGPVYDANPETGEEYENHEIQIGIFARVSAQGTAMPETALCDTCFDKAHKDADKDADDALDASPTDRTWYDCTENTELRCTRCGIDAYGTHLAAEV